MKFKKITYLIATSEMRGPAIFRKVVGFATDFYPVRFCVREECHGVWTADHYDTGCRIVLPFSVTGTREEAYIAAARKIYRNLISGAFQKSVEAAEKILSEKSA